MASGRHLIQAAIIAVAAIASPAIAAPRDDLAKFQVHMRDGAEAIVKKDFVRARRSYSDAIRLMPQHPTAIYRLALADTSLGKTAEAFTLLGRIAAMGLQLPKSFDTSFATLKATPEFATLKKEIARNTSTLCACTTVFDGPRQPFIAEGIAFDPRRNRLLIGSVYQRKIVAVAGNEIQGFSKPFPAGLSPFSITLDPARDRVWVSATSLAQSHGASAAQRGHSALIALRLSDGALVVNIAGPPGTDLGDAALTSDGAVYVTDSRSGGVFRLRAGGTILQPVTTGLSSAQGIAISRDNRTALVADYSLGLMRLELSTGRLAAIAVPDAVTTLGIDGLAALTDGSFLGTQNGIAPARIVRIRLSPDWTRVVRFDVVARNAASIADPSLISVSGKDIYVVGASQWASFDEEKSEPARPVPAFRIVRLARL